MRTSPSGDERTYDVAIERVVPEADGYMPFASEQVRLLETPMLSPLWGRTRALTSLAGRSGSDVLMWGKAATNSFGTAGISSIWSNTSA